MPSETAPEPPLETLTERELLVRAVKILQHLDPMIHELHGWAGQAAPLLNRFSGFGQTFGKGTRRVR